MNKIYIIILAAVATITMASCEKVSPIGVLVAGTGVEDRVKMSHLYYQEHKSDFNIEIAENGDYTFLVGADSHVTDDTGRMEEMLQIGLDANDLFYAHLGDIADTKAEYYINLEKTLDKYKHKYCAKKYKKRYLSKNYPCATGTAFISMSLATPYAMNKSTTPSTP